MVSPEEVQDLMDKISDSQADITMVADALAQDNSILESCDDNGEIFFHSACIFSFQNWKKS